MNTDRAQGTWTQMKGKLRERWGKLTDNELDQLEGKWEQVSGLIQQRYGEARDRVDEQLTEFRRQQDDAPAGPRGSMEGGSATR